MKKIKYLIITLCLLMISTNYVYASNTVDFSMKGSVKITLEEHTEETFIEGAELSMYKIGDALSENGNLVFKYTSDMGSCTGEITSEANPSDIVKCMDTEKLNTYEDITDSNGTITFTNVDLGVYLIMQTGSVKGYSSIDPFLVMLPFTEDNDWKYDVVTLPKSDIIRLMDLTVVKVWNDDKNHHDEIIVELRSNDEAIDEINLNKDNNWTYTFEDIPLRDDYEVVEVNVPSGYTVSYRNEDNIYTITNTYTLVQTGVLVWKIDLLVFLGIMLIATGCLVDWRHLNEKNK